MASTSDIRKGLCIKYSNDIYKIVDFLHVKPGKGPAFVRTKLKSVTTGKVIDNTFPAGHKIEDIRVETNKYQFLYNDTEGYHFMNTEDYNQIIVNKNNIETLRAETTMRADTLVNLDHEASEKVLKIMTFMDDLDDVQEVHTNAEFPGDFTEEE